MNECKISYVYLRVTEKKVQIKRQANTTTTFKGDTMFCFLKLQWRSHLF